MKYKVGDKVRIVDHRTKCMNEDGEMDKWLGTVMTIRSSPLFSCYKMEEDIDDNYGSGWTWNEEMIAGLATETITVEIDPSDPKKAYQSVAIAIDGWKKKREKKAKDWTDEEIENAKRMSRGLIVKLFDAGCSTIFNIGSDFVRCSKQLGFGQYPSAVFGGVDCYIAKPSGNDVFNEHIGKCVCLCKLTNTPIPNFIKNKNTEGKRC